MFGFVRKLRKKLSKSRSGFWGKLASTIRLCGRVDEDLLDELEEALIQSDVGVELSGEIIERLSEAIRFHKITDVEEVQEHLRRIMSGFFLADYDLAEGIPEAEELDESDEEPPETLDWQQDRRLNVFLFVGVNGVGKTTTIGKIAKRYRQMGRKPMLVAADTFRAAASEQLGIWAERAGVPLMRQDQGADPSAVVYDGINAAFHRGVDTLLIDTAGRQHTRVNLMNELSKIHRTIRKLVPDGPHETLLVVDAVTGQNAMTQAKMFHQATDLTGIVLTKLDGTARGGIVLSIKHQLGIPVKLIGIGEGIEDLRNFSPVHFTAAFFGRPGQDE